MKSLDATEVHVQACIKNSCGHIEVDHSVISLCSLSF